MRIKQTDLATFVKETLQNIRTGLVNARAIGIDTMPEMDIEFTCEVVQDEQGLTTVTSTSEDGTQSQVVEKPEVTETTTEGASTQTTSEGASTDTQTETGTEARTTSTTDTGTDATVREATTNNVTNGGDEVNTTNTWEDFS